jgi:hypothetical protein
MFRFESPLEVPRRIDVARLMLGAFFLAGCQTLLDAPDYHVESENALVRAFATPAAPATCAACLDVGVCGKAFDECAGRSSCSAFVNCLLSDASPAAEVRCVTLLEPSDADRQAAYALQNCYRGCVAECEGGQDFGCVDAFTWPVPRLESPIRITQSLSFIYEPPETSPVADARVSFCPPGPECENPLSTMDGEPLVAVTDSSGTYSVDVPITSEPANAAGFRGFRLVEGADFTTHRLESNVPFLVDRAEHTSILREETSTVVIGEFSAREDGAIDVLFAQVFDCRGNGAGDVFLDFPEAPLAVVRYKDSVSAVSTHSDGTLAAEHGAVVVSGLEIGVFNRVVARTRAGQVVAQADIYVPGDQIVLFSINPRERAQ